MNTIFLYHTVYILYVNASYITDTKGKLTVITQWSSPFSGTVADKGSIGIVTYTTIEAHCVIFTFIYI